MPSDVPFDPTAIPISPKEEAVPDTGSATGIFAAVTAPTSGDPSGGAPESPVHNDPPLPVETPAQRPMPMVREIVLRPAASSAGAVSDNPGAGEFTRIFQPLREAQQASPQQAPAQPSKAEPRTASLPAAPGEFTRLFQSARQTSVEAAPTAALPLASTPVNQGPFDLSQIPHSLDQRPPSPESRAPSAAPAAHQDPSGFTELFRQYSDGKASEGSTPAPVSPAALQGQSSPPPAADAKSFTEIFQSVAHPGAQLSAPPFNHSGFPAAGTPSAPGGAFSMEALPRSSQPVETDPSSFTQIMNALSQPKAAPSNSDEQMSELLRPTHPSSQPSAPPQPSYPGPLAGPGEFTKLMNSLERPAASAVAPQPAAPASTARGSAGRVDAGATAIFATPQPAAPTPPPQPTGPSEYTRIVSRPAAQEVQQAPTAQPAQGAGMPQQFAPPYVPGGAPQARAPLPLAPAMQPPPLPQAQMPAFGMPGAMPPQIPATPHAPPQPAAAAIPKLQQYLPLLLIANAVLMVALILVVIFAMKHH